MTLLSSYWYILFKLELQKWGGEGIFQGGTIFFWKKLVLGGPILLKYFVLGDSLWGDQFLCDSHSLNLIPPLHLWHNYYILHNFSLFPDTQNLDLFVVLSLCMHADLSMLIFLFSCFLAVWLPFCKLNYVPSICNQEHIKNQREGKSV